MYWKKHLEGKKGEIFWIFVWRCESRAPPVCWGAADLCLLTLFVPAAAETAVGELLGPSCGSPSYVGFSKLFLVVLIMDTDTLGTWRKAGSIIFTD